MQIARTDKSATQSNASLWADAADMLRCLVVLQSALPHAADREMVAELPLKTVAQLMK